MMFSSIRKHRQSLPSPPSQSHNGHTIRLVLSRPDHVFFPGDEIKGAIHVPFVHHPATSTCVRILYGLRCTVTSDRSRGSALPWAFAAGGPSNGSDLFCCENIAKARCSEHGKETRVSFTFSIPLALPRDSSDNVYELSDSIEPGMSQQRVAFTDTNVQYSPPSLSSLMSTGRSEIAYKVFAMVLVDALAGAADTTPQCVSRNIQFSTGQAKGEEALSLAWHERLAQLRLPVNLLDWTMKASSTVLPTIRMIITWPSCIALGQSLGVSCYIDPSTPKDQLYICTNASKVCIVLKEEISECDKPRAISEKNEKYQSKMTPDEEGVVLSQSSPFLLDGRRWNQSFEATVSCSHTIVFQLHVVAKPNAGGLNNPEKFSESVVQFLGSSEKQKITILPENFFERSGYRGRLTHRSSEHCPPPDYDTVTRKSSIALPLYSSR